MLLIKRYRIFFIETKYFLLLCTELSVKQIVLPYLIYEDSKINVPLVVDFIGVLFTNKCTKLNSGFVKNTFGFVY